MALPTNLPQAMEARTRSEVEKQVRVDMKNNGSIQAIDAEIQYRMVGEIAAVKDLSEAELTVAWKFGHSAGEYLKHKTPIDPFRR